MKTSPTTLPPLPVIDPTTGDGDRSHRSTLSDRDETRLTRLLALPTWALLALEIGWWAVVVLASVLEEPLVRTALAPIMPTAADWQITVGAIAYLVVYIALWHAVGHRLADARHLSLTSSAAGTSRRINPGFGAIGVTLLVVVTIALVGVAVRRALALAEIAAQRAVDQLVESSVRQVSPGDQQHARDTAWSQAFWPDLTFTFSVMALLAVLAIWIGYSSTPRHEALALHLARANAHRAGKKAGELRTQHQNAARQVATQQATAHDRDEQATDFQHALQARFARAKSTVRQELTYGQGRPEATSTLTDSISWPEPDQHTK